MAGDTKTGAAEHAAQAVATKADQQTSCVTMALIGVLIAFCQRDGRSEARAYTDMKSKLSPLITRLPARS